MVNCLGFLFVWWCTAQPWIIWCFCLSVGELAGFFLCPVLRVSSVQCSAWWWIVWGFCLSGGELPNELSGVSVCPVVNSLMVNCLGFLFAQWQWWTVCPMVNCPSAGELSFFFACLVVNCPMGSLSVQWWTAQQWIVWCFCWPVVNCLVVKCPLVNYSRVKCPTPICSWDCQCHSCMGLFSQCCNTIWIAQSTNEFQSSDARCLFYLLLVLAVDCRGHHRDGLQMQDDCNAK